MVREVDPELCFWGLNGAPMRYSKKKREGFRERLKILTEHFPEAANLAGKVIRQYRRYEVARDDVRDALVAAYCALRIKDCKALPEDPEVDPRGLRMEMVYLPHGAL
jgi:predicted RNase H-like nuclease